MNGVGNGGFSIRSVAASLDVIRSFSKHTNDNEAEDIFFVSGMSKLEYKIADHQIAYEFCVEVPVIAYENNSNSNPMALHSTWYYMDTNKIFQKFDKKLNKLSSSQVVSSQHKYNIHNNIYNKLKSKAITLSKPTSRNQMVSNLFRAYNKVKSPNKNIDDFFIVKNKIYYKKRKNN